MLIEAPDFKVLASRRDKPGRSEVHATDTDIFVVIDGQATIVVGGKMIEPKEISAGRVPRQRHRRRHQLSTREGRGAHDSAQYAALGARDQARLPLLRHQERRARLIFRRRSRPTAGGGRPPRRPGADARKSRHAPDRHRTARVSRRRGRDGRHRRRAVAHGTCPLAGLAGAVRGSRGGGRARAGGIHRQAGSREPLVSRANLLRRGGHSAGGGILVAAAPGAARAAFRSAAHARWAC